MENIDKLLSDIDNLKKLAIKRADELFSVITDFHSYHFKNIYFQLSSITVQFEENGYDCPDMDIVNLGIGELKMSDIKYSEYVNLKREEHEKYLIKIKKETEENRKQSKIKQFNDLKKELGL